MTNSPVSLSSLFSPTISPLRGVRGGTTPSERTASVGRGGTTVPVRGAVTYHRKSNVDKIVVLITTPSKEEAETIGNHLVEMQLAACVNIIPAVLSIFSWEGKRCSESETLLLVKTKRSLFVPLCEAVQKKHSYSVPEIIALPIVEGSSNYLQWIDENTR